MPKITFIKSDVQVDVQEGFELLTASEKPSSAPLRFGCKKGLCGVCAIQISKGSENLSKQCPQEKRTLEIKGFDQSFRLACQCAVNGDIEINK